MPRLENRVPRIQHFKPRNQAKVCLDGKVYYLGRWGSPEAQREYDRLIALWLAGGRRMPVIEEPEEEESAELTVTEVIDQYWQYAQDYYGTDVDGEAYNTRPTASLNQLYGEVPAVKFGPKSLIALRDAWIQRGHSRSYINQNVRRVQEVFRWAASEELLPAEVAVALKQVKGLRKGRSKAKDNRVVLPVDAEIFEATLPHLPKVVADMARLQRLTGARSGEICSLRPVTSIDRMTCGSIAHNGIRPKITAKDVRSSLGPQAQEILRPYLLRGETDYCFSPEESERKRLAARHEARTTPLKYGNRPGANKVDQRHRAPRDHYTRDSYRRAIQRACELAFPPPAPIERRQGESKRGWLKRLTPAQHEELAKWNTAHDWSPHQLRHLRATEIRRDYGLEAAQVILGHSTADVTQIYAERDMEKAAAIAARCG